MNIRREQPNDGNHAGEPMQKVLLDVVTQYPAQVRAAQERDMPRMAYQARLLLDCMERSGILSTTARFSRNSQFFISLWHQVGFSGWARRGGSPCLASILVSVPGRCQDSRSETLYEATWCQCYDRDRAGFEYKSVASAFVGLDGEVIGGERRGGFESQEGAYGHL